MTNFVLKNSYLHGFSTFVPLPAPNSILFGTSTSKVLVSSRQGSVGLSVTDKQLIKVRFCAVESKQEALLQTQMGEWEDPDDGSGSEYDDDDDDDEEGEVKENNLDFESDWEEERSGIGAAASGDAATTISKYEEDLLKGTWYPIIFLL